MIRLLFLLHTALNLSVEAAFFPRCASKRKVSAESRSRRRTRASRSRHGGSVVLSGARPNDDDEVPMGADHDFNNERQGHPTKAMSRPNFLKSLGLDLALPATAAGLAALTGNSQPASASLIRFPCVNGLMNTYHLMRAGQSLLEEEDVLSTNPLFLTNRECALSQTGIDQVEATCRILNEAGVAPTLVRYSLAANAVDASNIVGRELRIGRDRLVPEFFFLDPRAVGLWDNLPLGSTEAAVWAMDAAEAGPDGTGGRPPPNEDGTPHETLSDQVPRLVQLMSALESQFSGDTVLLIFPDGTGPALLTALIGGIPLNRVHEMNFSPGEVRLDVTYDSARRAISDEPSAAYRDVLERGRTELRALRADPDGIVSVRDRKYEGEIRAEQERAARRAEAEAAAREEADRRAREEREAKKKAKEKAERDRGDAAAGVSADVDTAPIVTSLVALGALGAGSLAIGGKKEEASTDSLVNDGTGNQTIASRQNEGNITSGMNVDASIEDKEASINRGVSIRSINGMPVSEVAAPLDLVDGPYELDDDDDDDAADSSNDSAAAQDPFKRADEAMKDYMDQDDGGDAWLGMLSEMMNEEEAESEPESKPSKSDKF